MTQSGSVVGHDNNADNLRALHVGVGAACAQALVLSVWNHDRHFVKNKKERSREKEDFRCSERLKEVGVNRYGRLLTQRCNTEVIRLLLVFIIHLAGLVQRGCIFRQNLT